MRSIVLVNPVRCQERIALSLFSSQLSAWRGESAVAGGGVLGAAGGRVPGVRVRMELVVVAHDRPARGALRGARLLERPERLARRRLRHRDRCHTRTPARRPALPPHVRCAQPADMIIDRWSSNSNHLISHH